MGDAYALKEIFTNVLDNAVKYNISGGSIDISHEYSDRGIVTIIQDRGRGITPNDLKRLFTPYFRGAAEKTDVPGTGLGLYIVKGLLAKMNGTITIGSDSGKGTICRIELTTIPDQHASA
jgi:signal transduction histidine kinase